MRLAAILLLTANGLFAVVICLLHPGMSLVRAESKGDKEKLPRGATLRMTDSEFPDKKYWGQDIAFSCDGRLVGSVGYTDANSGLIRVWDVQTGALKYTLSEKGRWTCRLIFTPNGKSLVTASLMDSVTMWNIPAEAAYFSQDPKDGKSTGIGAFHTRLSPDGRMLAVPRRDTELKRLPGVTLLECASGKSRGQLLGPEKDVDSYALTFSPDGRFLVGRSRFDIIIWDLATGQVTQKYEGFPHREVCAATFTSNARYLAVAGAVSDSHPAMPGVAWRIKVYDTRTNKVLMRVDTGMAERCYLAFSPDDRILAIADQDHGEVRLYDAATGDLVTKLTWESRRPVAGFSFSPDGKTLASQSRTGEVLLWDLNSFPELKKLKGLQPPADEKPTPPPEEPATNAEELDQFWTELRSDDAEKAFRAMWALALRPKTAVPFLRDHLKPVADPDAKLVAQLLTDLDSSEPATRKRARERLSPMTRLIVKQMKQTIEATTSAEVRESLNALLQDVGPLISDRTVLRGIRAIEVLEHMGGEEAKALLKELAKGAEAAPETQAANESLERLARSHSAKP